MSRKILIPLLAIVFLAAPVAMTSDAVQAEGAARATTVKSSKSNTSDRMGGGGGGKGAARATTVKSSKSNTSDRMGGGGGGSGGFGTVFLNPQPEPPGKAGLKKAIKIKNK